MSSQAIRDRFFPATHRAWVSSCVINRMFVDIFFCQNHKSKPINSPRNLRNGKIPLMVHWGLANSLYNALCVIKTHFYPQFHTYEMRNCIWTLSFFLYGFPGSMELFRESEFPAQWTGVFCIWIVIPTVGRTVDLCDTVCGICADCVRERCALCDCLYGLSAFESLKCVMRDRALSIGIEDRVSVLFCLVYFHC